MATIRAYTTIEQSRKLAEILPLESADMNYWCGTQIRIGGHKTMDEDLDIPCWSLAALLSVLPDDCCGIDKEDGKYAASYVVSNEGGTYISDNPIDACYDMIIKLHELKML